MGCKSLIGGALGRLRVEDARFVGLQSDSSSKGKFVQVKFMTGRICPAVGGGRIKKIQGEYRLMIDFSSLFAVSLLKPVNFSTIIPLLSMR